MISIFIPTFNAGPNIEQLLKRLTSQSLPCEIVIADSFSSDRTVHIVKSYDARVIKVNKEDFNHGRSRNLAATKGFGEIIVFMTQDAIPVDNYCIEKLITPLQKSEILASFARQISDTFSFPRISISLSYRTEGMVAVPICTRQLR